MSKSILCIVASPGDAELNMGGTLAKLVEEGNTVVLLVCTDGTSGLPDRDMDIFEQIRYLEQRKKEQEHSATVLGLSAVIILKTFVDGQLTADIQLRETITKYIRSLKPDIIITVSSERDWQCKHIFDFYHPDSLAVGRAVLDAVSSAENRWNFPELLINGLLQPHRVSEVLVYGAPYCNIHYDITDVMSKKLNALFTHKCRFAGKEDETAGLITRHARNYADKYGYPQFFVESFLLIKRECY